MKIQNIYNMKEFLPIWYRYHKTIGSIDNQKILSLYLFNIINRPKSIIFGLFNNKNEIVGFTIGYKLNSDIFYWEGIYIDKPYRIYLPKLLKESKKVGYKYWMFEASSYEGKRMLDKIAKVVVNNTYIKEITWDI